LLPDFSSREFFPDERARQIWGNVLPIENVGKSKFGSVSPLFLKASEVGIE